MRHCDTPGNCRRPGLCAFREYRPAGSGWGIIISKMNKRYLHHVWTKLRAVKPWYFLALTVVLGTVCLFALRHNNERMVVLRDAVYAADKNNGDVNGALRNLRTYVYAHMNTSLASGPNAVYPPIQLKYTYERAQAAAEQQLAQTNQSLYNDAQHYCEAQDSVDFSGRNRVPCIEDYVLKHGATLTAIPDALYKFDFVSAKWSPDLAGWTLVLTLVSAAGFVLSAVYHWWAKKYL